MTTENRRAGVQRMRRSDSDKRDGELTQQHHASRHDDGLDGEVLKRVKM